MNNVTMMRVRVSDSDRPVYVGRQVLNVQGYNPVGGAPCETAEDYVAAYALAGEYILQVVGKVEEQETFEDHVVYGFIVGEEYKDSNGLTKKCAFKVDGKQQWGFEYKNGFNLVDAQGVSLIKGDDHLWVSIKPATQRVSLGKKKVLVPVT